MDKSAVATLNALEAEVPLGYLTGLGLLRMINVIEPSVSMRWVLVAGFWRPQIRVGQRQGLEEELIREAWEKVGRWFDFEFRDGKELAKEVDLSTFRKAFKEAQQIFSSLNGEALERAAQLQRDWYTAMACYDGINPQSMVATDWETVAGSGGQKFLKAMRDAQKGITFGHLKRALFEQWDYGDKGFNLRLDPADDRREAYRFRPPEKDKTWTMWGATVLAGIGMSFYTMIPSAGGCKTKGFLYPRRGKPIALMPVWGSWLGVNDIKDLLGWKELYKNRPRAYILRLAGISEVYYSRKYTVGKYKSFSLGEGLGVS